MRIRRILLATDFSPTSEAASRYAAALAVPLGASIRVIHAFEPILPADLYGAVEVVSINEQRRRLARRQLDSLLAGFRKRGIRCSGAVQDGFAVAVILDNVDRRTDLLVLGTHGTRGFSRLLLGSVAEKVIRSAGCAVLTVRPAAGAGRSGPRARSRRRAAAGRSQAVF
ncbi:MAG: universal stress protein [Deltaproteobacteria bacterium]|nr:universal stress protein [Deltaproteobacteria bacterium]